MLKCRPTRLAKWIRYMAILPCLPKKIYVTDISLMCRIQNFGRHVTCNMACRIDQNGTVACWEHFCPNACRNFWCLHISCLLAELNLFEGEEKWVVSMISASGEELLWIHVTAVNPTKGPPGAWATIALTAASMPYYFDVIDLCEVDAHIWRFEHSVYFAL